MKEHDLNTTDRELHRLAEELDKVRSTSTTVKVPRDALAHLIVDHSRMAKELFVDRFHRAETGA
jgi:hypothetical protein